MLTALHIRDFAILEHAELPLGPGLTAITGETGAGKSILLDALALVLGGRASDKWVRHGCEQTEVEAQFEGVADPRVVGQLHELGLALDDQGTLVLRRVVGKSAGKNRCWANGRLITAAQLKQLAAPLVDLSAQHAQHRLLDPEAQLDLLDRFAGLQALRQSCEDLYSRWRDVTEAIAAAEARARADAERLDYLRFVHKDLMDINPTAGEHAALQAKIQQLRAAAQVSKAVHEAVQLVDGDGGAREQLSRAARTLAKLEAVDPKVAAWAAQARDLETLAGDLGFGLASHGRSLHGDDRELARLSERLDVLTRAMRKYGGSEAAMIERLEQAAAALDTDTAELQRHEWQRQEAQLRKELVAAADELSAARHLAAAPLATRIAEVVQQLGMPSAQLRMSLERRSDLPDARGWERASLHLRANLGEAEGPLAEVASGGELSRVLLAVQRALGDAAWSQAQLGHGAPQLPTAIYDEADAGLSGTTGLVLGRFLAEIGSRQQVLCISHLPQVAAAAVTHVQVVKREADGRTRSSLRVLDGEQRVGELARMLGVVEGERDTAMAHARQLLAQQRLREGDPATLADAG